MDPRAAFTVEQLARLTVSYKAREVSDSMRAAVPRTSDRYERGPSFTDHAATMYSSAAGVVEASIVAERLRGTTWEVIADHLGMPTDEAEAAYENLEGEFVERLMFPYRRLASGFSSQALPDGLEDPVRSAEELDAWFAGEREHSLRLGSPSEEVAPVSTGLQASADSLGLEHMTTFYDARRRLSASDFPAGVDLEQAKKGVARLRVQMFQAMAAGGSNDERVLEQLQESKEVLAAFDKPIENIAVELGNALVVTVETLEHTGLPSALQAAIDEARTTLRPETTVATMKSTVKGVLATASASPRLLPAAAESIERLRTAFTKSPAARAERIDELDDIGSATMGEVTQRFDRSFETAELPPAPTAFTRDALARLGISVACRDASDIGRVVAVRQGDAHAAPGELVQRAVELRDSAQRVVTASVVADRVRNASWEDIAEALGSLGGEPTEVRARFAEAENAFNEGVLIAAISEPDGLSKSIELPAPLANPLNAAKSLDGWVTAKPGLSIGASSQERAVSAVLHDATRVELLADREVFVSYLRGRTRFGNFPDGVEAVDAGKLLAEAQSGLIGMKVEARRELQSQPTLGRGPEQARRGAGPSIEF